MEAEEFKDTLAALNWKQADFCAKAGVARDSTSRWANGHTPIPEWVSQYLAIVVDVERLYAKYVATKPFDRLLSLDLLKLHYVRIFPVPKILDAGKEFDPNRLWTVNLVNTEDRNFVLSEMQADWMLTLDFSSVVRLTSDLTTYVPGVAKHGLLLLNVQVLMQGKTITLEPIPETH